VNIVRGIEKIFESLTDADNVSEWINLYAPIYHGVNTANGAGDVIFEEGYSISVEQAARETVAEKPKKPKNQKCAKKEVELLKYFLSFH
jgi:hypothetical protein